MSDFCKYKIVKSCNFSVIRQSPFIILGRGNVL
nr:MAG TPA: hypothetical protein [Caudoviricetes sp.]